MIRNTALYLNKVREYKLKDDEYLQDGVIYCKNCHTPRVLKDWLNDDMNLILCACECIDRENQRNEQAEREYTRQQHILRAKETTLMGNRYKDADFKAITEYDDQFKRAMDKSKFYCDNAFEMLINGYGLFLTGSAGSGKTYLAACIANRLIEQNYKIVFTNFTEIMELIIKKDIHEVMNCDFLFIDDIGTEKVSNDKGDAWLQEKVFDVINRRYNMMRPVIMTSNYSLNRLVTERGYAEKTIDRINEICQTIKVDGNNYRKRLNI